MQNNLLSKLCAKNGNKNKVKKMCALNSLALCNLSNRSGFQSTVVHLTVTDIHNWMVKTGASDFL